MYKTILCLYRDVLSAFDKRELEREGRDRGDGRKIQLLIDKVLAKSKVITSNGKELHNYFTIWDIFNKSVILGKTLSHLFIMLQKLSDN